MFGEPKHERPKIFAHLHYGSHDATAAFNVQELQRKVIQELPITQWDKHPNVPPDLTPYLEQFMRGQKLSMLYGGKDTEYLFRPISDTASYVVITKLPRKEYAPGRWGLPIEHLFIIDKKTGNIADLKDLWSKHPIYPNIRVITSYKRGYKHEDAHMVYTKKGPIIDLMFLRGTSGEAYAQTPINLRAIAPLHEIGHEFQQNNPNFVIPRSQYYDVYKADDPKNLLPYITVGSVLSRIPIIGKRLVQFKTERTKMERNAHAFALTLVRHLAQNGIDLTDQLPTMRSGIHAALSSYEEFLGSWKGPKFEKRPLTKISSPA